MKNIIYLDSKRKDEARVDRNEYFEKYSIRDASGYFKCLAQGAPTIININGTYYDLAKLPVISNNEGFTDFFSGTKSGSSDGPNYKFIWK